MDMDRLISALFEKEYLPLAHDVIIDGTRGWPEDKRIAFAHEMAKPVSDDSPAAKDPFGFTVSFARHGLGVEEHQANALDRRLDHVWDVYTSAPPEPAVDAPDEASEAGDTSSDGEEYDLTPITPAGVNAMMQAMRSPPPPPAPSGPTRAELEQKAGAHRRDLASPQGTEGWDRYYRGGGQQDYLGVLQALEAMPADAGG